LYPPVTENMFQLEAVRSWGSWNVIRRVV